MKRPIGIFYSAMVFSILLGSIMVNSPVVAQTSTGPVPIPSNIIPPPSLSGIPIIPWSPNLGTVSTAPPPVQLYSINQVQSGLVASDPLNNETMTQQQLQANPGYWFYYGSAPLENAPYTFFRDTQGLHIGVKAPSNGTWAGFYAESPRVNATLFHSIVTIPVGILPYQWYNNGMYVQTYNGLINYVTCAVQAGAWGANWAVVSTTGDVNQATQFNLLWYDTSLNQPLTRDCTLVTNGNNLLKVYLDGTLVYSNSTLNLQMPQPFNAYLEPQSSYPGQMLNGTWKDYYVTTDENIQVTNNPMLAATVKVVDPSGVVLASAPVRSGTAILSIGHYHMPLAGYIKIYDSLNNQLASTSSPISIYGGDVYSVSSIVGSVGPLSATPLG